MGFELYINPGALFSRRVLIYLAEKQLRDAHFIKITSATTTVTLKTTAPGKPPGSLPILALGNGTFIKQSITIIEYLEDLCDGVQSSPPYNPSSNRELLEEQPELFAAAKKTMRGRTAEEKARTREVLGLVDEATTHFSFACHHGSAMFSLMEKQSPATSKITMTLCRKTMTLIEDYCKDDHRFKVQGQEIQHGATTADCVLFALLQFAEIMYGIDLVQGLPVLQRFKAWFETRESAQVDEMLYDENLRKIASHWIEEKQSLLGVVSEVFKVVNLYFVVFGKLLVGIFSKS